MSLPASMPPPMLTPAELQKFEAPLIALANLSGGNLPKLFHAFFSFLHRRTDFYCILPNDGSIGSGRRMGFQEGQAEQIVLASFRQFPLRKVGPKPGTSGVAIKPNAKNAPNRANKHVHARITEEPSTKSSQKDESQSTDAFVGGNGPKSKDDGSVVKSGRELGGAKEAQNPVAKEKSRSAENNAIRYTKEGKQIPIGNGGSTSRYVWTQTLEEVTVHVPLSEGLRAKDLNVKIGADSLSICKKSTVSSDSPDIAPLEGTFFAKIKPSESTWTIESTNHSSQKMSTLQLLLDKVQKTWWSTVLSGDTPLIDTTMVDSTRHISTYDDDTQAQIRRIMFDQRQERMGLPTSQKSMLKDMPPMPNGEQFEGNVSLPSGVEYIDGETLEKASISKK